MSVRMSISKNRIGHLSNFEQEFYVPEMVVVCENALKETSIKDER